MNFPHGLYYIKTCTLSMWTYEHGDDVLALFLEDSLESDPDAGAQFHGRVHRVAALVDGRVRCIAFRANYVVRVEL